MGFLRKKFKQVKNAVKKVAKGIKKVVKKVTKSKLFKVIATIGAVLATGGAALGAFGGTFASSTLGQAIINSGQFFAKFNPTSFKPFTATGKFIGSSLAGKAGTAAVEGTTAAAEGAATAAEGAAAAESAIGASGGFGVQTGTLATGQGGAGTIGSVVEGAATKTSTVSKLARGTVLGDIARGVVTNVGTGMVMQQMQGDPEQTGIATGLNIQSKKELGNIAVAYSDAGINTLDDVYNMSNDLSYGTASSNFNTPMYTGETVGLTPVA